MHLFLFLELENGEHRPARSVKQKIKLVWTYYIPYGIRHIASITYATIAGAHSTIGVGGTIILCYNYS